MSDLTVSATEHGKLRVFALSSDFSARLKETGSLDALGLALGAQIAAPDDVQVVSVEAMGELGLSGLLREGYDVTPSLEDTMRLDSLGRDVALIRSAAFDGIGVNLLQTGEAELIATYSEGKSPAPKFTPLESAATKGVLTGSIPDAKPRRSFGARLAWPALAALIASFAWIYIYYIGF